MHSLETLQCLNDLAAERELSREYGRALLVRDIPLWQRTAKPEVWTALHQRTRALRARLLALAAAILTVGCSSPVPVPDIAGPCPPPPAGRLVHHEALPDGTVLLVIARPAR